MLTQKQKDTPFVHVFKLDTGEEIITEVLEDNITDYRISKPLQMVMGGRGPQFAPFMIMIDQDKPIKLNKGKIVSDAPPNIELENQYKSLTSNIALPQKSAIIT